MVAQGSSARIGRVLIGEAEVGQYGPHNRREACGLKDLASDMMNVRSPGHSF